jgi:uncharacterized delta-60 repeat protein/uncharacterized repeat protein (TIGR02543 family)
MQFKKVRRSVLWSILVCCLCANTWARSLVDTSFNPGSGVNGFVETVLQQPDGKVLVCGNFTQFNGVGESYIARLNSDGSVDTSFNAHPSYWVRTMALQPDGKIVIGGWFSNVEGQPRNTIARLNSDGSLDTSFNPGTGAWGTLGTGIDGKTNEFIFATAVQPDGKILITGNFTNYNGVRINGLARLNSNGSLDTTFDTGDGLNTWGRSLTLLNGGQFIVTGWFNHYNHADHSRMAIVNADGSAVSTFAPNFGDQTAVYSALPLPGGKYLVSGHSENVHQIFQQDIARLNADGTFDSSFTATANDKTEMVRLQSDGKILLCGYFGYVNGVQRTSVARLNSNGTLDDTFKANFDNFAWSMDVQSDGKILVAGAFHTVDGYSRNGIVRLFPVEQPEDVVAPDLQVTTPTLRTTTVSTTTLNVTGTASDSNGVARVQMSVNGQPVTVSGTSDWSASANLVPGTNVVVFSATDTYGNTASLTRFLFHPGKVQLTVTTDGNGKVSPNLNGAMLDIGHTYSITAVPKPGYVFNSWSGSVNSSDPTIKFTMDRGTTLQASFVPNPFTPSIGQYRGLVLNQDSPSAASAGTILLTLLNNGNFSARLTFGGTPYAIAGRFDSRMSSAVSLSRGRGKYPLTVNLQLADAQTIQGTVTDGASSANVTAFRNSFDARRHPAPASAYTALLIGNGSDAVPSGYGYFTASVSASGSVTISGALSDGTPTVQFASIADNGLVPFYISIRGETAFGWLTFSTNADNAVQGTIHWEKSAKTNLLFSTDLTTLGSVYHVPKSAPVLTLNDPAVQVDGGPLAQPLSNTFTLDSHNRVKFATPNPNRFTLSFVTANGRFAGSFVDASTRKPGSYQGVVLQKQDVAGGFFTSNRQYGRTFIGENGASQP